jgi:phosphoglycolate phosphatase
MNNNTPSSAILLKNHSIDSLKTPKALALDLDLTIYNITSYYDEALNQTLLHFDSKELNKTELKKINGSNFTSYKEIFSKHINKELAERAEEYHIEHLLDYEIPQKSIIPGAKELLYLVKKRFNIPVIGITNSEEILAKKFLKDLNILQSFDYVVGVRKDTLLKPDPQMLLIGLENINIKPGPHVWFIGDSPNDTKCAKRANCSAIRFYHKIMPEDPNADLFTNSHHHFFNIINSKLK